MTPALAAYRAATALAEPFAPLWLRRREARGKEERGRLAERLARDAAPRPPGRLFWLHGASVGESLSLLPLAGALLARAPELALLVTSGTVTSASLLADRLPAAALHRYAPLDLPGAARRFAARWRPDVAVFAESEAWPNLLGAVRAGGARTALVSARMSAGSLAGWARAPSSARALFGGFDLVLAQDDAAARGLAALGARDDGRLNLKLAGAPPAVDGAALAAAAGRAAGRPVLVAASTHPGEDEIVLDALRALQRPDALLAIVPRHPERGPAIAALARSRGLEAGLRGRGDALGGAPVYVADTLGELGLWYALADSTLVAGSLLPGPGGHNPLEPARLGAAFVAGPHVDNWREVYAALGPVAPTVADAAGLAAAWRADLEAPFAAGERGRAARDRSRALAPDLDATAARLLALIG